MLAKPILTAYSIVVILAGGGATAYVVLWRYTNLRGARFWAATAAAALVVLLIFHPSGATLDEVRTWLLPVQR